MRFYVRKRRTTPAVIIVALIDVLIVLVIFLLVTTTFKQRAALKLTLPQSSQAKNAGANENPPFIVSIDTNGVYFIEKLPVTFEQLQQRLKNEVQKNPEMALQIDADERAPWGRVVKVHDAATAANVKVLKASAREQGKP